MTIATYRYEGEGITSEGEQIKLRPRDILINTGPRIHIQIDYSDYMKKLFTERAIDIIESRKGMALIDTGATKSCIDLELAQDFSFPVIDEVKMSTPSHSNYTSPLYSGIMLDITAMAKKGYVELLGVEIANQGIDVIIGRDILAMGLLVYNGVDGTCAFAI